MSPCCPSQRPRESRSAVVCSNEEPRSQGQLNWATLEDRGEHEAHRSASRLHACSVLTRETERPVDREAHEPFSHSHSVNSIELAIERSSLARSDEQLAQRLSKDANDRCSKASGLPNLWGKSNRHEAVSILTPRHRGPGAHLAVALAPRGAQSRLAARSRDGAPAMRPTAGPVKRHLPSAPIVVTLGIISDSSLPFSPPTSFPEESPMAAPRP